MIVPTRRVDDTEDNANTAEKSINQQNDIMAAATRDDPSLTTALYTGLPTGECEAQAIPDEEAPLGPTPSPDLENGLSGANNAQESPATTALTNTLYFFGALCALHLSAALPFYLKYMMLGTTDIFGINVRILYIFCAWYSCGFFAGIVMGYYWMDLDEPAEMDEEERVTEGGADDAVPKTCVQSTFRSALGWSFAGVGIAWACVAAVTFIVCSLIASNNVVWAFIEHLSASSWISHRRSSVSGPAGV